MNSRFSCFHCLGYRRLHVSMGHHTQPWISYGTMFFFSLRYILIIFLNKELLSIVLKNHLETINREMKTHSPGERRGGRLGRLPLFGSSRTLRGAHPDSHSPIWSRGHCYLLLVAQTGICSGCPALAPTSCSTLQSPACKSITILEFIFPSFQSW